MPDTADWLLHIIEVVEREYAELPDWKKGAYVLQEDISNVYEERGGTDA